MDLMYNQSKMILATLYKLDDDFSFYGDEHGHNRVVPTCPELRELFPDLFLLDWFIHNNGSLPCEFGIKCRGVDMSNKKCTCGFMHMLPFRPIWGNKRYVHNSSSRRCKFVNACKHVNLEKMTCTCKWSHILPFPPTFADEEKKQKKVVRFAAA